MRSYIFLFAFCLAYISSTAQAQFFLHDEGHIFVDQKIKTRKLGIEVEFTGIPDGVLIELLKKHLDAKVVSLPTEPLESVYQTKIGLVRLKVEGQAWRYENKDNAKFAEQLKVDAVNAPRELVFPPLSFGQIKHIQALLFALKEKGAIGTTDTSAVSLQVNVSMPSLNPKSARSAQNVADVVNLMRVYSKQSHQEQAAKILKIPAIRKEYIRPYSKGFLTKLNNAQYKPTARELYDDYMYRQTDELLGHKDAWSASLEKVKARVLASGESEALIQVIKMNQLRVSSLFVEAFQDDPLSQFLVKTKWLKPIALVEFREFNNDFDVTEKVNMSLGVIRGAQLFGNYDHDEVVSQVTGISENDIGRLRDDLSSAKKNRQHIVRYALYDPKETPFHAEDLEWFAWMSPRTIHIQLAPDKIGHLPLVLPKGAVLWHRRQIHRQSILAEQMPGMENYLMQQVMENKLVEAKLLDKYAPGSMPDFVLLRDFNLPKKDADPRLVWKKLNATFPQGWVLKSAFDLASESSIITESIDIDTAMKAYENGFEEYFKAVTTETKGQDPEYVIYLVKKHPGYMGWKIKQVLKNTEIAFAQAKVKIKNELRIEVLGGNVLGHGSTVDRYAYQDEMEGKAPRPKLASRLMRDGERFAQSVLDRFPPELKIMPFAFDVALLEDGSWTIIETNPGGNSGFLEENPATSKMLVEYLESYPQLSKYFKGVLTAEQQMRWINKHLEEFGMPVKAFYPGYDFKKDEIVDKEFKPVTIDSKVIKAGCEELLKKAG
ncbi:MAG: amidoligase family protein [Bdellovibrionota bacterium]